LTLRQADLPGLPPITNAVAKLASGKDAKASSSDDADEEKPPAVDASLTEAEHIMVDYLSLLAKADVLTAGRSVNGTPPARTE